MGSLRSSRVALCLAAVFGIAAPAAPALGPAQASPKGPPSKQTHPGAHPRSGGRRTTFLVTLTARDALGIHGVVQTDYSIEAQGGHAGCTTATASVLTKTRIGQHLRVHLGAPSAGWCTGRYHGVVLFERGPYCPKSPSGKPQPCPEFASQALDVGRFGFSVR